jgi:hypothetical protein
VSSTGETHLWSPAFAGPTARDEREERPMRKLVRPFASALAALTLVVLADSLVYAQGGTTSTLSGIAVDISGAVLPGAAHWPTTRSRH